MIKGCTRAIAAVIGIMTAIGSSSQVARADPALEIDALYKVSLNDFDVGSFSFKSEIGSNTYNAVSDVRLSVAGLVGFKGKTSITGIMAANAATPKNYDFQFESPAKSGSIRMNFEKENVTGLTILPDDEPLPGTVPLQAEHIKNVVDPLSAVLAMVRVEGKNPCNRKVSIFDGKQRFDLVLTFRKETTITEAKPSGQPDRGIVCKVKYVPVAGYRPTEEVMAFAKSNGINITFRPIPSANLMVPHSVLIPTMAGDAVLTASQIKIKTPNNGPIALIN